MEELTDEQFKQNYRISKSTLSKLHQMIRKDLLDTGNNSWGG